jgi:sugar O-acyltransferase (sialic acid O-acetyltransferase NeuD family)
MIKNKTQIFIIGASGHAKVVIDVLERQGEYEIAFLVDDAPALKGKLVFGYRVIGDMKEMFACRDRPSKGIIAIGNNKIRRRIADQLKLEGLELVSAVHPSASLSRGVGLGEGTVVMAGAVINADTRIGRNVILNTKSSVDHDCLVGDGVHIAPGVTLCGGVCLGDSTFVGAGATVCPGITIGKNVTVGAGATVIGDVPDGETVVGVPARTIKAQTFESI